MEQRVKLNIIKRTAKDSVFTDLFSDPKYLLELYQALHPEDESVTPDSLSRVTIENIISEGIYNDLGMVRRDRLLVLAEAQSTWSENILVRFIEYVAETWHRMIIDTSQNIYGSRKLQLPRPECYVIYTGDRSVPKNLFLSKELFGGLASSIEVSVKVITERESDDIVNQYILFAKVFDLQRRLHGLTREAIEETIRICKGRNILKGYLELREKEVITMMMSLYDQEEITKMTLKSARAEERAEGRAEGKTEERISSIRNLMQTMKWTAKRAMDALDIPESEQARYSRML